MAGQEQQRPARREREDDLEHEPLPGGAAARATGAKATDDVDDLLDEIDDVLENNAEQFVRQYTQKGGQ